MTAGTAEVSATFTVSNFGAGSILFGHLGLGPVSTDVTLTGTLTCSPPAALSVTFRTGGPSVEPDRVLPLKSNGQTDTHMPAPERFPRPCVLRP